MRLRDGKAGENTIDRSIIKRISGAGLKRGRTTMSADPVTLNVSNIGELAVYAAVNALSAEMILPESFRLVILLPAGTQEERLREIMDQICRVCREEDLVIEGGHTEVTAAVTRPVVIGACTGVPMKRNDAKHSFDGSGESGSAKISSGQIVMTKWAGMEGSCILAQEKEELREVFPETILMRDLCAGRGSAPHRPVGGRHSRGALEALSEGPLRIPRRYACDSFAAGDDRICQSL